MRDESSHEKLQAFYRELKIHKPAFRQRSAVYRDQVSISRQSKTLPQLFKHISTIARVLHMSEHITRTGAGTTTHVYRICRNILLELELELHRTCVAYI